MWTDGRPVRTVGGCGEVEAEEVVGFGAVLAVAHDQLAALPAAEAAVLLALRLQLSLPRLQLRVPHLLLLLHHHHTLGERERERGESEREKEEGVSVEIPLIPPGGQGSPSECAGWAPSWSVWIPRRLTVALSPTPSAPSLFLHTHYLSLLLPHAHSVYFTVSRSLFQPLSF